MATTLCDLETCWRMIVWRSGLVTAVSCTCTILPKTGASNQIVFSIKTLSPPDGPDHPIRPKGHHSSRG